MKTYIVTHVCAYVCVTYVIYNPVRVINIHVCIVWRVGVVLYLASVYKEGTLEDGVAI